MHLIFLERLIFLLNEFFTYNKMGIEYNVTYQNWMKNSLTKTFTIKNRDVNPLKKLSDLRQFFCVIDHDSFELRVLHCRVTI